MKVNVTHKCSECKLTYKRYYDLRRHVKTHHGEKVNIIAPLNVRDCQFKCSDCNKQFSRKDNLKSHYKKVHDVQPETGDQSRKAKQKCSLCDYTAIFKKEYIKHYEEVHSIQMEYETIKFENEEEFMVWKDNVEKETVSKFVKEGGSRSGITNYVCHRSGFFSSVSKGKRLIKLQGSNKINGYCPAMIKQVNKNGDKCLVNFTKTHVGHQNEINRIFLTRSERRAIASKLAEEVPFDAVLDDIRKEISSSSRLERMHMLTKQDLFNIKASLNRHSTTASDQNETILIVYDKDEDEAESEIFYELMDTSSTVLKETLTERKQEMLNKLYVTVNNINTEAEWEALEKLVNPIESALAAVRQQSVINSITVKEFASTNKHTKQRRLFSPKKKFSFNQAKRRS